MSELRYGRTTAIIDLAALKENVRHIRAKLAPGTQLCAVVKANGYGHGAAAICPALREAGVDRFAVAIWQEGRALREAGVTAPIHILGDTIDEEMDMVIRYQLIPTVFSEEMAGHFAEAAREVGVTLPIDIKLDTGMHRIGFLCEPASVDAIERISKLPNLRMEGVFTHFARADEWDKTTTEEQYARFTGMLEALGERGVTFAVRHTANSAAIMDIPGTHQNMVRAGIILYGLYPSREVHRENLELKPVLQWVSHVSHVKTLPAGEPISYGGTHVTGRETIVATVPVGYADGYRRELSDRGAVVIRGKLAPILGRVCMDQMMVDVTDFDEVKRGEPVQLIGGPMDAETMAELVGTISYEIVCGISERVPRVYVDGTAESY